MFLQKKRSSNLFIISIFSDLILLPSKDDQCHFQHWTHCKNLLVEYFMRLFTTMVAILQTKEGEDNLMVTLGTTRRTIRGGYHDCDEEGHLSAHHHLWRSLNSSSFGVKGVERCRPALATYLGSLGMT